MAKSRRGGYRKPTAKNASNVVSGNGALSQRTDGNALLHLQLHLVEIMVKEKTKK